MKINDDDACRRGLSSNQLASYFSPSRLLHHISLVIGAIIELRLEREVDGDKKKKYRPTFWTSCLIFYGRINFLLVRIISSPVRVLYCERAKVRVASLHNFWSGSVKLFRSRSFLLHVAMQHSKEWWKSLSHIFVCRLNAQPQSYFFWIKHHLFDFTKFIASRCLCNSSLHFYHQANIHQQESSTCYQHTRDERPQWVMKGKWRQKIFVENIFLSVRSSVD